MVYPRLRFRFVWLLLLLLIPATASAPARADGLSDPVSATLTPEEQTFVMTLLSARSNAGLIPLTIDPTVTRLAEQRCADMATNHYFGHVTQDGRTVGDLLIPYGITYRSVGETLAMNWNAPDPGEEAAKDLMASPKHSATLFDPQYTTVGFGNAVSADGTHYFAVIVLSQ